MVFSERRIKFLLEIGTLLTAITALISVIFTYNQLSVEIASSRLSAYQQITSNSVEFDKTMILKLFFQPS